MLRSSRTLRLLYLACTIIVGIPRGHGMPSTGAVCDVHVMLRAHKPVQTRCTLLVAWPWPWPRAARCSPLLAIPHNLGSAHQYGGHARCCPAGLKKRSFPAAAPDQSQHYFASSKVATFGIFDLLPREYSCKMPENAIPG